MGPYCYAIFRLQWFIGQRMIVSADSLQGYWTWCLCHVWCPPGEVWERKKEGCTDHLVRTDGRKEWKNEWRNSDSLLYCNIDLSSHRLIIIIIIIIIIIMSLSLVACLFFLVLLSNQRWSPPLRLQVSDCSILHIMCDIPSIAVFCSESIECFPGVASKFFLKMFFTILWLQLLVI